MFVMFALTFTTPNFEQMSDAPRGAGVGERR